MWMQQRKSSILFPEKCSVQGECLNSPLLGHSTQEDEGKCLISCKETSGCTWYTFDEEKQVSNTKTIFSIKTRFEIVAWSNYNCVYSQTWVNDHLRIATTCLQWPPFWGPFLNFNKINDLSNNGQYFLVPRLVVGHKFECTYKVCYVKSEKILESWLVTEVSF